MSERERKRKEEGGRDASKEEKKRADLEKFSVQESIPMTCVGEERDGVDHVSCEMGESILRGVQRSVKKQGRGDERSALELSPSLYLGSIKPFPLEYQHPNHDHLPPPYHPT